MTKSLNKPCHKTKICGPNEIACTRVAGRVANPFRRVCLQGQKHQMAYLFDYITSQTVSSLFPIRCAELQLGICRAQTRQSVWVRSTFCSLYKNLSTNSTDLFQHTQSPIHKKSHRNLLCPGNNFRNSSKTEN
uniref:(northern house mosquito) hypothetical protein n=1 Tax=Culex pipiens TaxID=7175 RepID=A0A8D8C7D1_CULPI